MIEVEGELAVEVAHVTVGEIGGRFNQPHHIYQGRVVYMENST